MPRAAQRDPSQPASRRKPKRPRGQAADKGDGDHPTSSLPHTSPLQPHHAALGHDGRRSEEAFRLYAQIVDTVPFAASVWHLENVDDAGSFRLLATNDIATQITGVAKRDAIGRTMTEILPTLLGTHIPETLAEVVRSRKIVDLGEGRYGHERIPERVYSISAFPLPHNCVGVTFDDITERKRAEEALQESEERYRRLVDLSPEAIAVHCEGRLAYTNLAGARLYGAASPQELVGRPILDFVHPDYRETVKERVRQVVVEGKEAEPIEMKLLRLDGQVIDVELAGAPVTYRGKPASQIVARDITERKRAEEALRESEERYRLIAENTSDVVWTMDMNFRYTYVSAATPIRGYSVEEAMSQTMEEALTPASAAVAQKALAEELAIERTPNKDLSRSRTLELEFNCRDGSTVWLELRMTFLRDPDGYPVGILGVSHNITQRKRAEQALRRSEEHFRSLIESASDIITVLDRHGNIHYESPSIERILGYKPNEMIGRNAFEFVHPDDARHVISVVTQGIEHPGFGPPIEFRYRHRDGSWRFLESVGRALDDGASVPLIVVNSRDITERKRTEEALRESEARFRELADLLPQTVFEMDETGTLTYSNHHGRDSFGYSDDDLRKGVHAFQVLVPEDRDRVKEALQRTYNGERLGGVEYMALRKDGSTFPIVIHGAPILREGKPVGLRGIIVDITKPKQQEAALQKVREELEGRAERQTRRGNVYKLTFRELTVLQLVAAGRTDREIGITLGISYLTAQKHVANILAKMGAASRTEAGVRALREEILD